MTKNTKITVSIIIILVVLLGLWGFIAASSSGASATTDETTAAAPATIPTTASSTADVSEASKYKDGTYTATGTYESPGGKDQIGVTLTIANDIVTSASATAMPGDPTSAKYQQMFLSGYQAQVVGKNIDTLNLTKVSGSSLTPKGFDDAVAQIKTQAQA